MKAHLYIGSILHNITLIHLKDRTHTHAERERDAYMNVLLYTYEWCL